MNDEQAHSKLYHYLGEQFTGLVPMKVGRKELLWHKIV